jgi:hypothetical protein
MKLAHLGKLSKGAVNKLNNFLSKKLGRKVRVEKPGLSRTFARKAGRMARRSDPNIPVLRVSGLGIRVLSRGIRGFRTQSGIIRRSATSRVIRGGSVAGRVRKNGRNVRLTPRGRVGRATKRTTRTTARGRVGRVSRTTIKRPVRRAARRGGRTGRPQKPIPKIRLDTKFTRTTLSTAVPVYYVVMKRAGRMVKLSPKPYTLKDARDFLAYRIDQGLSRKAFFVPMGKQKKVVRLPKAIQGYYSRVSKKLRPYKIRYGRRRKLLNGYIEKRRFGLDTIGEKRELILSQRGRRKPTRRLSSSKPQRRTTFARARAARFGNRRPQRIIRRVAPRKIVRRVKRRISPQQRRILIQRLKKARTVRMKNLKKGR